MKNLMLVLTFIFSMSFAMSSFAQTKAEYEKDIKDVFDYGDVNKDNLLSKDELVALNMLDDVEAAQQAALKALTDFDKNGDANLSFAEFFDANKLAHYVGDNYGGGIVFSIEVDGSFLIADIQSQSENTVAVNKMNEIIKNPANYSAAAKAFTDWRLPTSEELLSLCRAKALFDPYGGFPNGKSMFYCSDEKVVNLAVCNGVGDLSDVGWDAYFVRAVRKSK